MTDKLYGILITDLSKAFDCLPHRLLIAKLKAYGLNETACKLVSNYCTGQMQRVKMAGSRSDWLVLSKGTPQGSILGPFIFNMLINDLVLKLQNVYDIYNYADDNIGGVSWKSAQAVCLKLSNLAQDMLRWFTENFTEASLNVWFLVRLATYTILR